ncbi:biotin--[acetyl-CoA-carboxylase] ligase [uncultured Desulfuromonas sp.]|uniref:biotin--[acetyl-CoA-carboxylase] ligase n=1 Tax=uncultured Desulfuromonas sp. TaxID=181013 RepID=UPI002617B3D5|nr:biotin--[acetyl-CoA-carboxylase] ligase [uncultured Desulfuromonas sp.]
MTAGGAREEILKLFRQKGGGFVSGEEISRGLGVSRSAVWKQIGLLREMGYTIEAVTSRGYRLTGIPDALTPVEIQAGLDTGVIGREVIYFEETDSTNARACALGEEGALEGTVVVAERQTGGKGRMGRRWASPPGVNLYTSVLLRPPIPPVLAPQLTFLSAVAVALAAEEVAGLAAAVKWPNDILLGGKKVAGLLNEMSAETEAVHYVVLGIGVNINMGAEQFPDDLRYPATSLALEGGRQISRLEFTRALYRHLDELYATFLREGFGPLRQKWQDLCDVVGRRVEVDTQGRIQRGIVLGLESDGALLLEAESGEREKILAGDVRLLDG